MKADVKAIFIILLASILVAENEAWWRRRSSGRTGSSSSSSSRRTSSTSSRSSSSSGSSSSSTSSSSSSSNRRGWWRKRAKTKKTKPKTNIYVGHVGGYGIPRQKPDNRKWVYGVGYVTDKSKAKPSSTLVKDKRTKKPTTSKVHVATRLVGFGLECKIQLSKYSIPGWIIGEIVGIRLCCIQVGAAIVSMLRARIKTKTTPKLAPQADFSKNVSYVTTVERPFNDKRKGYYGKRTINCLHRYLIKTSISDNPDTITHSGILVTTEDNVKYLIHKAMRPKIGNSYGRVEYAGEDFFLDGRWKAIKHIKPVKRRTIDDYYKQSEPEKYNIFTSNCHHATNWMANLAER